MAKKEFHKLTEEELNNLIKCVHSSVMDFAAHNLAYGLSDPRYNVYTAIEKAVTHEWERNQRKSKISELIKDVKNEIETDSINEKPPIGLIPHNQWVETRIINLADIIIEYTREGYSTEAIVHDWAKELAALTEGELL